MEVVSADGDTNYRLKSLEGSELLKDSFGKARLS